jgi:hypothetical protein
MRHQTAPFIWWFLELRNNGKLTLAANYADLVTSNKAQGAFVLDFQKWCIDRCEDHGEPLRELANMEFKTKPTGETLITCMMGRFV